MDQALINQIVASAGAGTALIVVFIISGLLWTRHSVDEIKRERDLANARAEKAEAELNAALRFTAERTAPMLEQFVSATGTLIPILQGLIHYGLPPAIAERDHDEPARGRQRRDRSDGRPGTP